MVIQNPRPKSAYTTDLLLHTQQARQVRLGGQPSYGLQPFGTSERLVRLPRSQAGVAENFQLDLLSVSERMQHKGHARRRDL